MNKTLSNIKIYLPGIFIEGKKARHKKTELSSFNGCFCVYKQTPSIGYAWRKVCFNHFNEIKTYFFFEYIKIVLLLKAVNTINPFCILLDAR